jgi:hypothetical protein
MVRSGSEAAQCVQLLQQELAYGREEHEQWLRGPGKDELCVMYQNALGDNLARDKEAFEKEVQAQLRTFDMCASPVHVQRTPTPVTPYPVTPYPAQDCFS